MILKFVTIISLILLTGCAELNYPFFTDSEQVIDMKVYKNAIQKDINVKLDVATLQK